jgi:hypothetical protein
VTHGYGASESILSDENDFHDMDLIANNIVIGPGLISADQLQREQLSDKTLTGSWQFAKCGKGN